MKKFIFLFLIALLIQSCAAIIAGAGKSGIGGSDSGDSYEDPLGGIIGVETTIYNFNENSTLKTGINVTFQGADYVEDYSDEYDYGYDYGDNQISGKVALTYLNLPLLCNYMWESGFYAEAGIQPGFLLSAKDKMDGGGSYDFKNYVKGFELGLPIGFGYNVNEQLSVGVRGVWGLTNNCDSGSGDKDHNYIIMGLVSYNLSSLFSSEK